MNVLRARRLQWIYLAKIMVFVIFRQKLESSGHFMSSIETCFLPFVCFYVGIHGHSGQPFY